MGGTFLGMRASTQIVGCMERYYGSERNLNRTYKEGGGGRFCSKRVGHSSFTCPAAAAAAAAERGERPRKLETSSVKRRPLEAAYYESLAARLC